MVQLMLTSGCDNLGRSASSQETTSFFYSYHSLTLCGHRDLNDATSEAAP